MSIKRTILSILLVMLNFGCLGVDADEITEVYYTNNNGVEFTKEEYDFVGMFYYDGYQDVISNEKMNYIRDEKLMERDIKVQTITDIEESGINPLSSEFHKTASKKLTLTSTCSSTKCNMSLVLEWLVSPKIRSYDLMGVYTPSSNKLKFWDFSVTASDSSSSAVETRKETHGLSATGKLPSNDEGIYVSLDFETVPGVTLYASYQHAKKTISLANSRKYSFSASGYGKVFLFNESVSGYYDAMGGVKMVL